jgi:hypothetical protein
MTRNGSLLTILLLAVGGCSAILPLQTPIAPVAADWRQAATSDDRERLRGWRNAFVSGLRAARAAGHGEALSREGALLDPDAAITGGAIPNGDYRCRVIKLGAKSAGMLDFVSYPAFRCRVRPDGALQGFAKLTGSQRLRGLIYPGDGVRQVFLGTLVLGDEAGAFQYGRDRDRDVAGFVERVAAARWRLVMPRPHFESQTDVLELIPAA